MREYYSQSSNHSHRRSAKTDDNDETALRTPNKTQLITLMEVTLFQFRFSSKYKSIF